MAKGGALPLLLVGGAAVVVMSSKKKRKRGAKAGSSVIVGDLESEVPNEMVIVIKPLDPSSPQRVPPPPPQSAAPQCDALWEDPDSVHGGCFTRYWAPGWIRIGRIGIPIVDGKQAPPGFGIPTAFSSAKFAYREIFSDGQRHLLTAIGAAYGIDDYWAKKPTKWSARAKRLLAGVVNHSSNRAQLERGSDDVRFNWKVRMHGKDGWQMLNISVSRAWNPDPSSKSETTMPGTEYPTIYFPPE